MRAWDKSNGMNRSSRLEDGEGRPGVLFLSALSPTLDRNMTPSYRQACQGGLAGNAVADGDDLGISGL